MNKFEEEIKQENKRIRLEDELKDFNKENIFKSELFENIIKYSKDIFDFKKTKLINDIDVFYFLLF